MDPVTQQYCLRARFYNPVVGRFTQEDTYRGDGLNLYAYCENNPISYTDFSGHSCSDKDPIGREVPSNTDATNTYADSQGNVNQPPKPEPETPTNDRQSLSQDALQDTSDKNSKKHTPDQQAVIALAKEAKKAGGITEDGATTLMGWAKEYGVNTHGPETHPDRPGPASHIRHIHVGKVAHIPIVEGK